jgi:trans-aconitate 2-methyltransferase
VSARGWSPEQYARFAGPRLQPGLDLLARIADTDIRRIVDLGCGAGAFFPVLRTRWPEAELIGVDSSPAMLRRARDADGRVRLVEADAARWTPEAPVDLIFSNALLHWLADHAALLRRLLRACRILAIQIPNNFQAPSHALLYETLAEPRWRDRLAGIRLGDTILAPATYHALLSPLAAQLDIWETVYWHVLEGPRPVLEWVRGTTLVPVLDALSGADADAFETEYAAKLERAYPPGPDGRVLFPFRRLFLLVRSPTVS